ncbi:glycosyltransferase family 4 protein [Flaviflagellibacter deserti]|uniref:Glycosyltransferase family 4 protein n=1 Tax=Flaviflagellibacter deserti TaxID=2267266 RepID=A0ABV9Z419_9HYPH
MTPPSTEVDVRRVEVIAPNFKRRLSGVTSTLERVVPEQARSVAIAALGPGLSASLPKLRCHQLAGLWRAPADRPFRIWHARRNIEMLAGILLRDLLRMPLRLVFTSASQRRHTGWTRFLIGRMDAVIATSSATASYLERPSTVIRHGIDLTQFKPPPDRTETRRMLGLPDLRLVGCFGRIRAQKGTDVFVEAMLALLPARPDAGAVVLGRATGPHASFLDALKTRVADAGLSDRLLFADEVPPEQTPRWYQALDVYVAPQRWEGFGVTPLEAMATGMPVVATTVGAFPELLVDGESGFLVPPGDVPAMTSAIATLLDDMDRSAAMSRQARTHVAAFSLAGEAEAINAVYRGLWERNSSI